MEDELYLDTETYSDVPITAGTYKYAENASIIMWQYAIGDGEVEVIDWDEPYRIMKLLDLLKRGEHRIVIHNSMFDRNVIRYAAGFDIPVDRIYDTMVGAYSHALPGALGQLCDVLGVPTDQAKDSEGRKWINLFCKPHSTGKIKRADKFTHPQEWEKFRNYGKLDIIAMREVYKRLPKWNYTGMEKQLWCLDQKINDRGVHVDLVLTEAAIKACTEAQDEYAEEMVERTDGVVDSATKRDKLLEYILSEYGVLLDDLTSANVEKQIENTDLPLKMRELLMLRLKSSKTSTSKYKRVRDGVNKDGRLRGLLQFGGASRTLRWSGRLFQPQNLPSRGVIKHHILEKRIEELKAGALGLL